MLTAFAGRAGWVSVTAAVATTGVDEARAA